MWLDYCTSLIPERAVENGFWTQSPKTRVHATYSSESVSDDGLRVYRLEERTAYNENRQDLL